MWSGLSTGCRLALGAWSRLLTGRISFWEESRECFLRGRGTGVFLTRTFSGDFGTDSVDLKGEIQSKGHKRPVKKLVFCDR